MICAQKTRDLLLTLRRELHHLIQQEDLNVSHTRPFLEQHLRETRQVLQNAEDDFSIVLSLIEQDPDCLDHDLLRRIKAMIDYLDIACAIFEPNTSTSTTSHVGKAI